MSATAASKRRVLIVAATTGYQTRRFAEAAAAMGVEPVLATDRCHVIDDPWADAAIPVRFEEPADSVNRLAKESFDGIVGLGDWPACLAAQAAERLSLPFHSAKATRAAADKHLARDLFRRAGLPSPDSYRLSINDHALSARFYPCVLKPLGLSASRGVIRADDDAQFRSALRRIRSILRQPDIRKRNNGHDEFVQVEAFIEGREFALEGIVTHGLLQVLAIFDKPDPLDGPYFEESIYVTPSREPAHVQEEMIGTTKRAIDALELYQGPVHAEMRVNQTGVYMLEVAPRPIGGLCAGSLRFDRGVTLEELILLHALGEDVSQMPRETAAAGVMMIPIPRGGIFESVQGVPDARAVPGIDEILITAKPGQVLLPLPEGASYLGFIFSRSASPVEAERALRLAHQALSFTIQAQLPLSESVEE